MEDKTSCTFKQNFGSGISMKYCYFVKFRLVIIKQPIERSEDSCVNILVLKYSSNLKLPW